MTSKSFRPLTLISVLILTTAISGCASNGGFKFIRPSRKDVLTEGTKKQLIEHNEFCTKQGNCAQPDGSK